MESARNAITSFLGGSGSHKTDVDEVINPAVTEETVKPHVHEETTEAIDREVHQDHYHTTVQPVEAREVVPEQHTHNLAPQIEKTFDTRDVESDRAQVEADLGSFQNTSTTQATTQSSSATDAVAGEHIHHHVHEVVQPVIHKETIQPEYVHTTVPIHEKHTAPSEHHGLSTLPVKTLDEFKAQGTDLTEKHHSHHEYEGHPRSYNPNFQEELKPVDINPREHDGTHDPVKTGHYSPTASRPTTSEGAGLTSSSTTGYGTSEGAGLTSSSTTGYGTSEGAGVASSGTTGYGTTGGSTLSRTTESTTGNKTGDTDRHLSDGGASASRGTHHETTTGGELTGDKREPTNLTGGAAEPKTDIADDGKQHASQLGTDPSLVTSEDTKSGKLTGSGVDGSHSAVFGLTPDGHRFDDTKHSTGESGLKPAEGEKSEKRDDAEDTGSRGVGTGKVAEQMNDPRVAEKGHDGLASYGDSTNKPGAGS